MHSSLGRNQHFDHWTRFSSRLLLLKCEANYLVDIEKNLYRNGKSLPDTWRGWILLLYLFYYLFCWWLNCSNHRWIVFKAEWISWVLNDELFWYMINIAAVLFLLLSILAKSCPAIICHCVTLLRICSLSKRKRYDKYRSDIFVTDNENEIFEKNENIYHSFILFY